MGGFTGPLDDLEFSLEETPVFGAPVQPKTLEAGLITSNRVGRCYICGGASSEAASYGPRGKKAGYSICVHRDCFGRQSSG